MSINYSRGRHGGEGGWGWDGSSARSPKFYLGNAFSLNMLQAQHGQAHSLRIEMIYPEFVPVDARSIVGHESTAQAMSRALGRPVAVNRESVTLLPGDVLFVAQYHGDRLPEGATELPNGAYFDWWRVLLVDYRVQGHMATPEA